MSEWISVKERLPNADIEVFIARIDAINDYGHPYCYEECVDKGFLSHSGKWFLSDWDTERYTKAAEYPDGSFELEDVTHWMPLPEQPMNEDDV